MGEIRNNPESSPEPEPEREPQSAPENPEIKTENEPSPEAIEKIMAKVQDINEKGTAYHALRRNWAEPALKNGLLGQEWDKREEHKFDANEWGRQVHKTKDSFVHFNIVGRGTDLEDFDENRLVANNGQKAEIGMSTWVRYAGHDRIAIIFDLTGYTELTPRNRPQKTLNKTFRVADPEFVDETKDVLATATAEEKQLRPDTEYGFVLSHRVAPRLFRGIVFQAAREKTEEEVQKQFQIIKANYEDSVRTGHAARFNVGEFNEKKTLEYIRLHKVKDENPQPKLQELIALISEINKNKPEQILPIYDVYGNLLWPKQMSHNEVKQFVAERDAKKQEK